MISSLIWTALGKPQLNGKVRRLGAYDGHQMTWSHSLDGHQVSDEGLPAVKVYKAHVKLVPGSQPMFCNTSTSPRQVQREA